MARPLPDAERTNDRAASHERTPMVTEAFNPNPELAHTFNASTRS
jgi:hypothetical protein